MMTRTFRCFWLWSGYRGMDSNEVLDSATAVDELHVNFQCEKEGLRRILACDMDTT
jgi:hypothetical protein